MKFFPQALAVACFLTLSHSALAEVCSGQFDGTGSEPLITVGEDFVDISEGLSFVVVTASPEDYKAESRCNNVMDQKITLPYFGRLVAIEPSGEMNVSGEKTWALFEIKGFASAGGKTDEFNKKFRFEGIPGFSSVDSVIPPQAEANSVCGTEINIRVAYTLAAFATDPIKRGNVRVEIDKVRLRFAPVLDPNDPKCVNRPDPVAPNNPGAGGIGFGEESAVEIVSAHTQKCVDVAGFAMSNAAKVQQWSCAKSKNQLFELELWGENFTLRAKHSGHCLAIGGGQSFNGALSTQIVDCASEYALNKMVPGKIPGAFTLRSAKTGKCLDIDSGKSENGQPLQQWDCVGNKWQEWFINPVFDAN